MRIQGQLRKPFLRYKALLARSNPCRGYVSGRVSDPLRILFCGSEEFSIASLRALYQEHIERPDSIASIDVVCRPGKRVGRGLKALRQVPISSVARELSLVLHQIDTFTGWTPPRPHGEPINLIIAVSFGLLVPPRILQGAKYGGLNVHPSLLPDFQGPAPLQHTLLAACTETGVTLQSLHPTRFDHGRILAQTLPFRFDTPFSESCTVADLMKLVAPKGAQLLLDGIRKCLFVPDADSLSAVGDEQDTRSLRRAPKITPEDRHIDWNTWSANEIIRRHRVIGPLWNTATSHSDGKVTDKRIIWVSGFSKSSAPSALSLDTGLPFIEQSQDMNGLGLKVKTSDGALLRSDTAKVEGGGTQDACHVVRRAGMLRGNNISDRPTADQFIDILK